MEVILQRDFLILVALWVVPHILALKLITNRTHKGLLLICFVSLMAAFLLKPSTSDLPKYSIYFDTGFSPTFPGNYSGKHAQLDPRDTTREPFSEVFTGPDYLPINLFESLSKLLHSLFPSGRILPRLSPLNSTPFVSDSSVVSIMIIGSIILLVTIINLFPLPNNRRYTSSSVLTCAVIILGSVFFMTGSQNVVRQFLGTVFLLLSLSLVVRRWHITSLGVLLISVLFHAEMFLFWLISAPLFFLLRFQKEETIRKSGLFGEKRFAVYGFLTGCLAVIFLKYGVTVVGDTEIGKWLIAHKYFLPQLNQYLFIESVGLERIGAMQKCILIALVVVLSEVVSGIGVQSGRLDIRTVRLAAFTFTVPLVLFPEIYSRILFVYFAIELLYVSWSVCSDRTKTRIGGLLVFLAYGIAPNCINILVGRGWVYGFA